MMKGQSNRITKANMERMVCRINDLTGNNREPYTKQEDGTFSGNVGTYLLGGAYNGWRLEQMDEGGGTSNPINSGYVSKRELYTMMSSFLSGLRITLPRNMDHPYIDHEIDQYDEES